MAKVKLKADNDVLVVHGSAAEVANAAAVLSSAKAWEAA